MTWAGDGARFCFVGETILWSLAMIGAVVVAEDFGMGASWGRILTVGCGSRAVCRANLEATWVGVGWLMAKSW